MIPCAIESILDLLNYLRTNRGAVHKAILLNYWTRMAAQYFPGILRHSMRVAVYAEELALATGNYDPEIRHGAISHDIGKLIVPWYITRKSDGLSPEEIAEMQMHPLYSGLLLYALGIGGVSREMAQYHHEKWDGLGYPFGLHGEQIPMPARILTVCDTWEALRSARPYKPAWTIQETEAYFMEHMGRIFDPNIAEFFLAMIRQQGYKVRMPVSWFPLR